MPILLEKDYEYPLPKLYKVKQSFDRTHIDAEDVAEHVRKSVMRGEIASRVKPGQKVAVAVGSRGIKNLYTIVKTTVDCIRELGGEPFIVSAMGSHGSGTEEGQREVLYGYGITEENLGIPVNTTVDVVELGKTSGGKTVYFDRAAYEADLIVPINRVKLHTDFVGDLQSGLCKMLVIGLGNHIGCSSIHEEESDNFADIIEEAASIILEKTKVAFGVATLENAYDQTYMVEAVAREDFIKREKELVKIAKANMPYIMLDEIDVLIVEEIGKNVSGAGFDPNILGRSTVLKTFVLHVPKISQMILLDVTEESHGNAIGMGLFDIITKNVFEKADLESIYANAIACRCIEDAKVPLMVKDEDEAVRVALKLARGADLEHPKIAKIKNTLELEYIYVSEALLKEVRNNERLQLSD